MLHNGSESLTSVQLFCLQGENNEFVTEVWRLADQSHANLELILNKHFVSDFDCWVYLDAHEFVAHIMAHLAKDQYLDVGRGQTKPALEQRL